MRDHAPRDLLEPLLHRPDRVAVEVRRPLLELGEVLDRPQAPLRPVDLLVEHAAQAGRVEPEPPLLRADVRAEVELAGRVAVHVAVEARHAHAAAAGVLRSSVRLNSSCGSGVSSSRMPSSCTGVMISLNSVAEVAEVDDLPARHVAQLRPVLQEDRRRELGQERLGQVELDVEPLQPREHVDLHLREHLPAVGVQRVRQRRVREDAPLLDLGRATCRPACPTSSPPPAGRSGRRSSGLPRDIFAFGSSFGVRSYRASSSFRWAAITFGLAADLLLHHLGERA